MELCSTDDQGRPDDERTGVPETRQRMKFTTAALPLASVPRQFGNAYFPICFAIRAT